MRHIIWDRCNYVLKIFSLTKTQRSKDIAYANKFQFYLVTELVQWKNYALFCFIMLYFFHVEIG